MRIPSLSSVIALLGVVGLPQVVHAATPGLAGTVKQSLINNAPGSAPLELVAAFDNRLVTGVTVSPEGRVFVNFPYWYPEIYNGAVAEVQPDGTVVPYPNEEWNSWRIGSLQDPREHFVCVQSVVADSSGSLWVLDPGAPWPTGMIDRAPKLVKIDIASDRIQRVYPFSSQVAPRGSYLNDVRIDEKAGYAYITESGKGAIITVNLRTGEAKRLLENHPSTKPEKGITVTIDGKALKGAGVAADGIALDADGQYLYYHPLTGYHTYRVPTRALRELAEQPQKLAGAVEELESDAVTDGMHMDASGNLYFTALEYNGILKRTPEGNVVPVILDERLSWPDTLAISRDGYLYITTSQIHLTPRHGGTMSVDQPWGVWRIRLGVQPTAH